MTAGSPLTLPPHGRSPAIDLLVAVAAAAVATQVKTLVESTAQPLAQRVFPPRDGQLEMMGADPTGHPGNMPPHILLDKAAAALGNDHLSDHARDLGSQVVHWATGIGAGVAYGLLARRFPGLRAGRGVAFGALLLAGTHGSLLPAIGIQESLTRLPRSWWVWEPGSHLVFGAVLDVGMRVGTAAASHLGG